MKTITLIIVIVLVLAASFWFRAYRLVDHAGATLYSKGDEAFLFLGSGHTGYSCRYLECALTFVLQKFNSVPEPDREVAAVNVVHLTPAGVERHMLQFDKSSSPSFVTPFEDGLYGMCPGSVLCKLENGAFVPATDEERRLHGGLDHLIHDDMNDKTINGWYVRSMRGPGDHFQANVGGKFSIDAKNLAVNAKQYPNISIDLLRPNATPESLYKTNGAPRWVSKDEFVDALHKQP